jgi:hypothetical protein
MGIADAHTVENMLVQIFQPHYPSNPILDMSKNDLPTCNLPGTAGTSLRIALPIRVQATIAACKTTIRLDISIEVERSIALITLHREPDMLAGIDMTSERIAPYKGSANFKIASDIRVVLLNRQRHAGCDVGRSIYQRAIISTHHVGIDRAWLASWR